MSILYFERMWFVSWAVDVSQVFVLYARTVGVSRVGQTKAEIFFLLLTYIFFSLKGTTFDVSCPIEGGGSVVYG